MPQLPAIGRRLWQKGGASHHNRTSFDRRLEEIQKGFREQSDSISSDYQERLHTYKSELILLDSLPFEIVEIFLIQHESGLLMAYEGGDVAGSVGDVTKSLGGLFGQK